MIASYLGAIRRNTRPRNRNAPSTPCSLQSRSFSGGDAKREKSLAVSAPYRSMSVEGSTTLRFDFDIFIERPTDTFSPQFGCRHLPSASTSSGYRHPCFGHSMVCMHTIPWDRSRRNGSFPGAIPRSRRYLWKNRE